MSDLDILERETPARVRVRDRRIEPAVAGPAVYRAATPADYNFNAPLVAGADIAALVVAVVMALGPLTAYALGYGL